VKTRSVVFWIMPPYRLVGEYQSYAVPSLFKGFYVIPKRWYPLTLHVVRKQDMTIWISSPRPSWSH